VASSVESNPPTQVADATPAERVAPQQAENVPPANSPENVPPTNASATVQPEETTEVAPRSTGAQVAATGIDIASGMALPALGVVNTLLSLTGNRTIGERLVDALGNPIGDGGTVLAGDYATRGKDYYKPQSEKPKTVALKAKDFADTYLTGGFVDTSKRPTPGERWNYNTPGFA